MKKKKKLNSNTSVSRQAGFSGFYGDQSEDGILRLILQVFTNSFQVFHSLLGKVYQLVLPSAHPAWVRQHGGVSFFALLLGAMAASVLYSAANGGIAAILRQNELTRRVQSAAEGSVAGFNEDALKHATYPGPFFVVVQLSDDTFSLTSRLCRDSL